MRSFSHYLPLSNSRGTSIHVEDFQSSRIQFIIASVTQSSPVYLIFWQVQIRRFSLFQIEIHLSNCLIYSYNLYSVQHTHSSSLADTHIMRYYIVERISLLLQFSTLILALPTHSSKPGISPNPLVKRAPFALTPLLDRPQGGPVPRVTDITIDCWLSEDLQYICNADCHAILCLKRPDVL